MLYHHQLLVITCELIYVVQAAQNWGKMIVKWDYCGINVSNGTKPLPELMLTFDHLSPVPFIWGVFHKGYLHYQLLELTLMLLIKDLIKFYQRQMSW